ncbi:hypothetical protein D3C87_2138220 [compost metagenome]
MPTLAAIFSGETTMGLSLKMADAPMPKSKPTTHASKMRSRGLTERLATSLR